MRDSVYRLKPNNHNISEQNQRVLVSATAYTQYLPVNFLSNTSHNCFILKIDSNTSVFQCLNKTC